MLVWSAMPKLVILGFVALAASLLYWPLQALFLHVPLSYNEGWNAFHALRLRSGGPLYPPITPDLFINYPPLSFYLVSALAQLVGDDVFAGRILATAALVITAINVGFIAHRLGIKRDIAIIAALAFFCFIATFFTDYVGVDDPQWQIQALQTGGLLVLLSNRRSWPVLATAALFMVLGGLVKHSALIMPAAITLWLLVEDRAALRRWCISLAAIGLLAVALCYAAYGQNLLDQIFGLGRTYSLATMWRAIGLLGPQVAPFVIVALIAAFIYRHTAEGRFVGLYVMTSIVGGLLLMTGAGVIYNTLFDLVIAMLLGSALFARAIIERYGASERSAAMATALMAFVLALRFIMIAPAAVHAYDGLAADIGRLPAWNALIEKIRTTSGPIACETLALCYWAGRRSEIEFFNYGQRARLDPGFEAPFRALVDSGGVALIQLDLDTGASRLTPALKTLMDERYTIVSRSPAIIMVPR